MLFVHRCRHSLVAQTIKETRPSLTSIKETRMLPVSQAFAMAGQPQHILTDFSRVQWQRRTGVDRQSSPQFAGLAVGDLASSVLREGHKAQGIL